MKTLLRLAVVATAVPFAVSSPVPVSPVSPVSMGRVATDAFYRSAVDKALENVRDGFELGITLRQDHSAWEDPWRVRQSPFVVQSTDSWFLADHSGRNLVTMLGHFEALLDRPFPRDEERNVLVFPDITAYNNYGQGYGVHSSILGSFYAEDAPERPIAACYHSNPIQLGMWLTHSAAHMYVSRVGARALPVWMDEGLASYFSYYFWAYEYGVDELERLGAAGQLTDLEDLLDGDLSDFTADNAHARFVQLAMLFTFMIHHFEPTMSTLEDAHEGSFVDYLRKAIRGERLTRHPVHTLLENPESDLEPAFRAFAFPR